MSAGAAEVAELREFESRGEYEGLIDGLRERVGAGRRTLADPWVKEWCGLRWRNLFMEAAAADPAAVRAAAQRIGLPGTDLSIRTGLDRRPDRHRIAARFLKQVADGEWDLELPGPRIPDSLDATLVFCPGLINSMLPMRGFQSAFPAITEKHGWRVIAADAHPVRGCSANVADLVATIERGEGLGADCERIAPEQTEPPGDVLLVGYSKGVADALTLLAERPDLAPRVKAVYCWAGAVGGSYLADDIYDAIRDLEIPAGAIEALKAVLRTICPLVQFDGVSERLDQYDVKGAIRDLTTVERERFLAEHADEIDALDVPFFNITGATTALEVPLFSVQGYLEIRKRDPDNDMQVTQAQARMATPMATDLAVLRAHHWDMSYDPFPLHTRMGSANLDHPFPREAALTAIFQLTAELGLIGWSRRSSVLTE